MDELREAFTLFDTEKTGRISIADLRLVLDALSDPEQEGSSWNNQVEKLRSQVSSYDDDDLLDFDDYLQLMESISLQNTLSVNAQDEENFSHVFEMFDTEQKGYITLADLERVAHELGEHDMTREELEEMIERAHPKQKGRVTLSEFTKLMTLNLFQKLDLDQMND